MKFIKLTPVSLISNGLQNIEMKESTPIYVNMDKIRHFGKEKNDAFVMSYLCYEIGDFLTVKETPEEIVEMINGAVENKPEITEEELREMMKDPKYWKDQDPEYVKKVENGFKKLYSDK